MHRLGMAVEHGHAHAGGIHANALILEDFLRLPDHLHLFARVAIVLEGVDVGNGVKGNLLGIHLALRRLTVQKARRLPRQLFNGRFAGTGYRLVRGHVNALDTHGIVDRLQGHQHLDRGAIGVGDNALLVEIGDRMGVDFRDNQRHVRVHTPVAGIVNHHRAGLGSLRGVLRGDLAAR